jgi:FkbM family methyltransferase
VTDQGARELELPNGMVVRQIGGLIETRQIYREIFEDDVYVQEGIELKDGDVVVDVGANIGMFALRVLSKTKSVKVVSVEPVPPLFDALSANVKALLERDGDGKVFRAVNAAAGAAQGEADFEFYPRATAFSTMFPAERARLEPWLLEDLLTHYGEFRERFPILGTLLYPFRRPLMKYLIKRRTLAIPVHCEVRTLSRILDDEGVTRVDLLKIDVEGAELHVVRGIEDRHWPAIAQVALEVQDLDGRMDEIKALLTRHGFDVVIKPDDPKAQVKMVYARRPRTR